MATLIVEERGELKSEVWALRSLIFPAFLEIIKDDQKVEEATHEKDVVVEDVTAPTFA